MQSIKKLRSTILAELNNKQKSICIFHNIPIAENASRKNVCGNIWNKFQVLLFLFPKRTQITKENNK